MLYYCENVTFIKPIIKSILLGFNESPTGFCMPLFLPIFFAFFVSTTITVGLSSRPSSSLARLFYCSTQSEHFFFSLFLRHSLWHKNNNVWMSVPFSRFVVIVQNWIFSWFLAILTWLLQEEEAGEQGDVKRRKKM